MNQEIKIEDLQVGEKVILDHQRKGRLIAEVESNDAGDWMDLKLAHDVNGLVNNWLSGETLTVRKSFCRVVQKITSATSEMPTPETPYLDYAENIGKKVCKTTTDKTPKPFKSGLKINTVKSVIEHPTLKIPAYTFEEDDSYVECRRCIVLNEQFQVDNVDLTKK